MESPPFTIPGLLLFEASQNGASFHSVVFDDAGAPVDYTFDAVNPAFETLTGLKKANVLGRTAREVFPVTDQSFFERVFRTALTGESNTHEYWSVPLGRRIRMNIFQHKPHGFGTTFIDLAQEATPAEKDHMDEARYRTFFELPNAVKLIIDTESHFILEANQKAEEFYGWSRDELKHMRIDQLNTMRAEDVSAVIHQVKTDQGTRFEMRHRLRNGELREVLVYTTHGPWGQGMANYAIIHDVTETKRMERRSLQTERLKAVGELTASLYHEFGNLLGILFTQIQLMEIEIPPGAVKDRLQAKIGHQFDRARKLIESVKRFSKDQGIEMEATRLSPLLEDLVEIELPTCRLAGIQVTFVPSEDDSVQVDAALIQQVFLNLFKNAIEALASTPSPQISIVVLNQESEIVVRFANNGPAIPPQDQARLFTPFFSTKRGTAGGGTGLGLSFSWNIIHNHGGSLFLEDGPGTAFQIRLPHV